MEQEYQDEIDLMDYVKVLLERRWLILAIFLGTAIVAGIFSFSMPKVYLIDTSLEIGRIGTTTKQLPGQLSEQLSEQLIESPIQLVEKIKDDVYGNFVREKLGIPEDKYPKIKVENPQNTNLIKMEIESANPELAKNILSEINEIILKEHQEQFDKKKAEIEENIKEIQTELSLLKKQKIYGYKDEGIVQLQITLLNLKAEMNTIKPTRVIKSPNVSYEPIKPRPALNIVIAAVFGLFIGIFLAFLKEWWKVKQHLKP